jgi:DNA-binding FrmR family transcriptional regulator
MNVKAHDKVKSRVNRIAGQVGAIKRIILTQIAAVRSALDALGVELLTNHIESCVIGHGTGTEHKCAQPMTKEQLLAEVQTTLSRFLK